MEVTGEFGSDLVAFQSRDSILGKKCYIFYTILHHGVTLLYLAQKNEC